MCREAGGLRAPARREGSQGRRTRSVSASTLAGAISTVGPGRPESPGHRTRRGGTGSLGVPPRTSPLWFTRGLGTLVKKTPYLGDESTKTFKETPGVFGDPLTDGAGRGGGGGRGRHGEAGGCRDYAYGSPGHSIFHRLDHVMDDQFLAFCHR